MSAADPEDKTKATDTSPQALMHILEVLYAQGQLGEYDKLAKESAYKQIQAYISKVIKTTRLDELHRPIRNQNSIHWSSYEVHRQSQIEADE